MLAVFLEEVTALLEKKMVKSLWHTKLGQNQMIC